MRSSDGCPVHPQHSQYYLIRLFIGSVMGGWSAMLVFMIFGFLGSIEFTRSANQVFTWVAAGGGILGIILGIFFAVISAIILNLIPWIKRTIHPLALVRAGFMLVIAWPLLALIAWPATGLGFAIAPVVAVILAFISVITNPHSELVPHSTTGRLIGTSVGPFIMVAAILIVIIPTFNRGFGTTHPAKALIIAADGVDGQLLRQYVNSDEASRYPNLKGILDNGSYGTIGSNEPLIAARMWAEIMTSLDSDKHGIKDINNTEDDFRGMPIWEILASRGRHTGLFQVPPVHNEFRDGAFDIPAPNTARASSDPLALVLGEVRWSGRSEKLPSFTRLAWAACMLVRHGVKLATIEELARQYIWEVAADPSQRLIYERRKLLEFRVETDCALALLRSNPVDVAILRFASLEPIFEYYWRYAKPSDFGPIPAGIDSWEYTGLGQAIPDSYLALDRFIGELNQFTDVNTSIFIISNHGMKSATDRRREHFTLSPSRLIRILGLSDRLAGDQTDSGICLRPVSDADETSLAEINEILTEAAWQPGADSPAYGTVTRPLFMTSFRENCLEVALQTNNIVNLESNITMGGFEGPLPSILLQGEQPSGRLSGNGLFLASGPPFKSGATARDPFTFDIGVTMLHAMGMEISSAMIGHTLDEIFKLDWLQERPVVFVDSYEIVPPAPEDTEVEPIDLSPVMVEGVQYTPMPEDFSTAEMEPVI